MRWVFVFLCYLLAGLLFQVPFDLNTIDVVCLELGLVILFIGAMIGFDL